MRLHLGRELSDVTLAELLAELDRHEVRLTVEDGQLRCVAPPGVLTPALVAAVRHHKGDLLRHVRRERPSTTDGTPLSAAQQRLWLHHQIDPASSAYHLPVAVALSGPLHLSALRQAVGEVTRRHAALRTTVAASPDGPVQYVATYRPPPAPLIDLSGLPEPARRSALAAVTTAHAVHPFDLSTGPTHRTALVRRGPTEHTLLHTRHHILSDGWSFGLVAAEISAAYEAATAGRPNGMPDVTGEYEDVARRQRQRGDADAPGDRPQRQSHPDGAHGTGLVDTSATGDSTRPVRQLRATLPAGLSAAVEAAARTTGTTPFAVLVTAFGLTVAAVSRQRDLTLGTPVSGRGPGTERLIGCFATMAPLPLSFGASTTFADALGRTHEVVRDALANRAVPLDRRESSFDVAFTFQNTPTARLTLDGVTAVAADPEPVAAKYPLAFTVTANGDGHLMLAEFDATAVRDVTVAAIVDRFPAVLARACRQPTLTCAQLVRETAGPRCRPGAARSHPPVDTLGASVMRRATARPHGIAATYEGAHLSYGTLLRRARQVAHALRAHGLGPQDRVVVCVEHSLDLLVAIVGCAVAGYAYVPVDPEDPPARHESVIVDAGAAAVVTTTGAAASFAWFDGPVLAVDHLPPAGPMPPRVRVSPDDLAYVIYTSGTTGAPKGVMVSHRNVLAMFAGAGERLRFTPDDVWTLLHSSAFDFSVWEMWGALLHGGRLVIVPRQRERQTDALRAALRRDGVTVLSATPSAFYAAVHSGILRRDGQGGLRAVVLGGERVEPSTLRDWFAAAAPAGGPVLVNMYGITETTVHVTYRELTDAAASRDSPIGGPLPGVDLHAVDLFGAPVPEGGHGELLVGGAGVARGYLGRPGLTADRFRPDDLSGAAGARVYVSGDLAVRLPGGEFGYIGRLDRQVKLRGYRIEPGEIEAALVDLPEVAAAAVVSRRRGAGAVLVAYVVPSGPDCPDAATLRRHLSDRLPAHLVPVAYPVLERLPLTRNGKLDRDALGRIDAVAATGLPAAQPRTDTEHRLATLWRELLGVEAVGVRDNFFDLGGDSLLMTRLHGRLPVTFGVQPPMRDLYQAPDLAAVARLVDRLSAAAPGRGGP